MYNQTYKILAKHFAETVNVNLVFEENGQPRTDGKTIYLPTELSGDAINLTLGALLHETAHIRYTDCGISLRNDLTQEEHQCLNYLEDIRIDHKTLTQYPNAIDFQQNLINDVIRRHKDKLTQEPVPQQILKSLLLMANKIDPATVYNEDIIGIANKLSPFINEAINANDTATLLEPAKKLTRLLIGEVLKKHPKQQPQDQQQESEDTTDQSSTGAGSSSSGNGNDTETDGQEDADSEDNEEEGKPTKTGKNGKGKKSKNKDQEELADKYEKTSKKYEEEENNYNKSQTERNSNTDKYADLYQEYKNLRRTLRLNETQRQKLNWIKRQQESENHPRLAQETQEKITEKEKRIKEINDKYQKAVNELKRLQDRNRELTNELNKSASELTETQRELAKIQSDAFGKTGKTQLLGFQAIDRDALKPDRHLTELDARQTLDELIKDALIIKRDQILIDEEGSRLNNAKLADIYTDTDQAFLNTETKHHKTQVAIIVDCSGSMGGYDPNYEDARMTIALSTVKTIADALQKAIRQGAPADFSIYGFADNVVNLTPDADNYSFEKLLTQYHANVNKIGGGTNLAESVTAITEELKQNTDTQDRCAVIITDAEVGDSDLDELINHADTDGARYVFVAIQSSLGRPAAQKLFGENNIKNIKDGAEVLQRALFSVL